MDVVLFSPFCIPRIYTTYLCFVFPSYLHVGPINILVDTGLLCVPSVYTYVARKKYFLMHIYIIEVYGFVNICILQEMQNIFKPISVWTYVLWDTFYSVFQ